jgi:hypothetical protein
LTFCFPSGYSEYVSYPSPVARSHGSDNNNNKVAVEIVGPAAPTYDQGERCRQSLQPLLLKDIGSFCRFANDGQCSIGASYQPPLPEPNDKHSNFIGTSSFHYAWEFLQMPQTATLRQFKAKSDSICSMSFGDVMIYFSSKGFNVNNNNNINAYLPYFCFLSSYTSVLLQGKLYTYIQYILVTYTSILGVALYICISLNNNM